MNIEQLKENLRASIVEITFHKVDGSMRIMRATLNPEFLPESDQPIVVAESEDENAPAETVLKVWDMNVAGWRSMRIQNIMSVNKTQFIPPVVEI